MAVAYDRLWKSINFYLFTYLFSKYIIKHMEKCIQFNTFLRLVI